MSNTVLVGCVVGAILILCLIRGVGFFAARQQARRDYRRGMNAEITNQRRHIRYHGTISPPLHFVAVGGVEG